MDTNPYQKYISTAWNPDKALETAGEVSWQSPSNIAIVKYWGKYGLQLPRNPSISLTLEKARTETRIAFTPNNRRGMGFSFLFEGNPNPLFGEKKSKFLHSLLPYFPFLDHFDLKVDSRNTFPHSSGIASSASSMSALVMCLLDMEAQLSGIQPDKDEYLQKASYLARLGSGSASRSVFPQVASWGLSDAIPGSSNYYGSPLSENIHEVFKSYRDSILIISSETKKVSSRAGHALMDNNPFANIRYAMANTNTATLYDAMKTGDQMAFCEIAEAEALQLHALMMTSNPSFILMEANTIAAIKAVQAFRADTGIPVCFTLDAGPNLHLLYPEDALIEVRNFIESKLLAYCHQQMWIDDKVGNGPTRLQQ